MSEIINKKPEELTAEDVEKIVEAARPIVQTIVATVWPIALYIAEALKRYPNKRVLYLATHGKKRVRKKNIQRIKADILKRSAGI